MNTLTIPPTGELTIRDHVFLTTLTDTNVLPDTGTEDRCIYVQKNPQEVLLRTVFMWATEYMPQHRYVLKQQLKLKPNERDKIAHVCSRKASSVSSRLEQLVHMGILNQDLVRKFCDASKTLIAPVQTKPHNLVIYDGVPDAAAEAPAAKAPAAKAPAAKAPAAKAPAAEAPAAEAPTKDDDSMSPLALPPPEPKEPKRRGRKRKKKSEDHSTPEATT